MPVGFKMHLYYKFLIVPLEAFWKNHLYYI
jgi:hypothetical protein